MHALQRLFLVGCLALSLLFAITGCTTWSRQPIPTTDPPAFLRYQVWTRDSVMTLQKVRIEHDTLYGIPATDSRDCSSCTLSLPMTRVDSLRTAKTEHIGTALLGAGAGAIAVLVYIVATLAAAGTD
jgi:hypothetical protein